MRKLRKAFASSVMFVTVFAMSGILAPLTDANAAASAGSLIKMEGLSSVYYLGSDNKRYVFPNEQTFFSWYSNFDSVITVPQAELESYMLGANVSIRPGTKLVKITTNPNVYAVTKGGQLLKIPDEATASTLYGSNWSQRVIDVPDAFFTNYTVTGGNVSSSAYPQGSLVKYSGDNDVYYVNADGTASKISNESVFQANRLNWSNVISAPASVSKPSLGTEITGQNADIIDTSSAGASVGVITQPGSGSGITVNLAGTTPGSRTVPDGSSGVVVTRFNVTAANDGAVTINDLAITRTGIGAPGEISRVFIYEGDARLTSGKTVNSSTNKSTFNNLGIVIAAGTTRTLSIVINDTVADNGTGNHAFAINAASDIGTNGASVSGSFPVRGNAITLSSVDVGTIDVESNGNDWSRKVGETNIEVSNFSIHVDDTEDAIVEGITLYNSGDDVISNLKLYRGSALVGTAVQNGRNFTFVLSNPYAIGNGESASFIVKGDIGGKDGDSAELYVRYSADVKVKGKTYDFNLGVALTEGDNSSASYVEEVDSDINANTTSVQAGQVTISLNGPTAAEISKNTNNVVLVDFALTPQTGIDIEKATINISGTNLSTTTNSIYDEIDDLELVCNGQIKASWDSVTEGDNSDSGLWSLPKGTTNCQIRVDIKSAADGNETIVARIEDLTASANWTIRDSNTQDTITDVIPSGNQSGQTMSITAASLAVSQASTPAGGQTFVKGSTDAEIAGFVFAAGEASDVKITAITLAADLDTATTSPSWDEGSEVNNVINQVRLYDGDTPLATAKSLTDDNTNDEGTVTFDGLDWTIPAGTNKKLTVKVGISSTGVPLNDNDDVIAIGILSVTSEYGSGTNVSATGLELNTTDSSITVSQTVTESGTLTAALDSNSPDSALIVAGTSNVTLAKIKFGAANENIVVEKLQVNAAGDGDEYDQLIVEYTNSSGNTESKSATISGGSASFSGLDIFVEKDEDAVISLKANLNTTAGGADNDDPLTLTFDYDTNFRALAQGSGTVIEEAGSANLSGETSYIFESIPTVAFASDTPSGELIPVDGLKVAKIGITASAGDDIVFNDGDSLTINFSLSGGTGTGDIVLKNGSDTLSTVTGAPVASALDQEFTFDNTNPLTIAAGTTEYIDVYLDAADFNQTGDTIRVWLDDEDGDIVWGINSGTATSSHADIIFRGELIGGALSKS